jgi:phage-related protein
MSTISKGVEEIRIWTNTHRVFYVTKFEEAETP